MSDPLKSLSHSDLYIINNALNEICNGVHLDEWDFETRMGVDREAARSLLDRVNETLRKSKPTKS